MSELSPGVAQSSPNYSVLELIEKGNQDRASNNLKNSLESYERAALLSVPSTDLLFLIAAIHKITGNIDRGTWLLGEVLRREPNHVAALEFVRGPKSTNTLPIIAVEKIEDLLNVLGFRNIGEILVEDIDVVYTPDDLNSRRRRDAEILSNLAANCNGNILDIGTSTGCSAYQLATNVGERGHVFTVNILPEQYSNSSGEQITHLLTKEQIGIHFREKNIANITQFYADTTKWNPESALDKLSLAFIDGAHDAAIVYSDSKIAWERLEAGGFIIWHDFSPELRISRPWIDDTMRGVEKFYAEIGCKQPIYWLRNSWCGVMQKPRT